jgi:hypothetical protein
VHAVEVCGHTGRLGRTLDKVRRTCALRTCEDLCAEFVATTSYPERMEQFEKVRSLGRGAQGVVILVRRKADRNKFCIKKIYIDDQSVEDQQEVMNEIRVRVDIPERTPATVHPIPHSPTEDVHVAAVLL